MSRRRKAAPGLLDVAETNWMTKANCRGIDTNLFFPERGASTSEARAVCQGCIVRDDCLGYAMARGEKVGIWGGLSERQRRRMRKAKAVTTA